jgi:serine/threonine protein kinase
MKQVCLVCSRSSADKNLYCQETGCPAEKSPLILEHGEWVADIEIVKPVIVLRSSTLYEAVKQNKRIFLKIAHAGQEHSKRLEREANLLDELKKNRQLNGFLPEILLPYPTSSKPYGQLIIQNQLLYYYIFNYLPGEPLRDMLARRPQPWIDHVIWIASNLSATISLLQAKNFCHLSLCPEAVLINLEERRGLPRLLLIDLGMAIEYAVALKEWRPSITYPAYTAPELLEPKQREINYRSDVYGLGLILYELLIGQPAYPTRLLDDPAIYRAVKAGGLLPMSRGKDVGSIAEIAEIAVSMDVASRFESATIFNQQLKSFAGKTKSSRESWWPAPAKLVLAGLILLAVTFIFLLGVTLLNLIK